MYHGVRDGCHSQVFACHGNQLWIDKFDWQMSYVRRHHQIVSLDELVDGNYNQKGKPPLAVTFDDGYQNNYLLAYPVLRKYGIPATIFLTAGLIGTNEYLWTNKIEYAVDRSSLKGIAFEAGGERMEINLETIEQRVSSCRRVVQKIKRLPQHSIPSVVEKVISDLGVKIDQVAMHPYRPLNWGQVSEMRGGLITFGSHTVNHCILTNNSDEDCWFELTESKKIIENHIQDDVRNFCYPNGNFDERIVRLVKEAGYSSACGTINGRNSVGFNPFAMQRLWCLDQYSNLKFIWDVNFKS